MEASRFEKVLQEEKDVFILVSNDLTEETNSEREEFVKFAEQNHWKIDFYEAYSLKGVGVKLKDFLGATDETLNTFAIIKFFEGRMYKFILEGEVTE